MPSPRTLVRAAVLLGALAAAPAAHAGADLLAYQCGHDLCTMDPDVGAASNVNLTQTPNGTESWPEWSPDGTRIAFREWIVGWGEDLFTLDADAGPDQEIVNVTQTTDRQEFPAVWSPDGTRIAAGATYNSNVNGLGTDVFVSPADGSSPPVPVGSSSQQENYPDWSPDGTKLAFARGQVTMLGAADGSGTPAYIAGGIGWDVDWSPDGGRLATTRGANRINVFAPDGSGGHDLPTPGHWGSGPVFSPDSRQVAYITDESQDVWVAPADGSSPGHVIPFDGGVPQQPSWSPDGTRIAFFGAPAGSQSMQIFVAAADGSAPAQQLTSGTAYESQYPRWKPRAVTPSTSTGGGSSTTAPGGGAGGAAPLTPGALPVAPPLPAPTPTRVAQRIPLSVLRELPVLNNFVPITFVICPAGTGYDQATRKCVFRGTAEYTPMASVPHAAARRKVAVATGSVTVAPGARKQLRLKLTGAGRRLLRAKRRLQVTIRIEQSVPGAPKVTTTHRTTLRAPRKR